MRNFDFNETVALDLSEMVAIDGGNWAKDTWENVRDFCVGLWEGLAGN